MIEPGTLDLWTIRLDAEPAEALWPHLSADERSRAERFRREQDRRRYVVARGRMRTILAGYLGRDPAALAFGYGPQGKPELPEVHFNLAHSHELALLAVAAEGPVGVDLEWIDKGRDAEGIVRRFFTDRERRTFDTLPDPLRIEAFFRGWTGKEAYLKAIGKGLAGPLEGVGVEIDPREPARLVELPDDDPARWTLHEFRPAEGYRGTLIARGSPAIVRREPSAG